MEVKVHLQRDDIAATFTPYGWGGKLWRLL